MSNSYINIEVSSTADVNTIFRLLRFLQESPAVEDIEYEVD